MAIAPNTTFVSGAILTAAQMNALPFGIVALGTSTSSSAAVNVETLSVTSNSFTAIANRYYKITYFEPALIYSGGTVSYIDMNIRLTNLAGALQQNARALMSSANGTNGMVMTVKTLSAGPTILAGCFAPQGGGTATAFRAATDMAFIIVEDLGPA